MCYNVRYESDEQRRLELIDSFKCIKNLGPFKSIERIPLARTTLIFAENGSGKTMLSEMFRSLANNEPDLVAGRARLGEDKEPLIVLGQHGDGKVLSWNPAGWKGGRPKIAVFNDGFVDANVYSGLEVGATHRQGLHSVVIGEEGVRKASAYADAQKRGEDAQAKMNEASKRIHAAVPGVKDVDGYCDKPVPHDVEEKIKFYERQVALAKKASEIEHRSELQPLELPELQHEQLLKVLSGGIPQVTGEAVKRVSAHLDGLKRGWDGCEAWVHEGWTHTERDGDCPYCGQSLTNSQLASDFADYFEDAYVNFKGEIASFGANFDNHNSEGRRRAFDQQASKLAKLREKWGKDGLESEGEFRFKESEIVKDWQAFAEGASRALAQKEAAPLESANLDQESEAALDRLNDALAIVVSENRLIPDMNLKIRSLKQSAVKSDLKELEEDLAHLGRLRQRNTEEVAIACQEYVEARSERKEAQNESKRLNRELNEYREGIFQEYGDKVNRYLSDFGARFQLAEFVGISRRGGGSSRYEIVVNNQGVEVASENLPVNNPSFKNMLSGGDRTALALAFFFASLDHRSDLGETVVVIDDPLSSLDDGRRQETIDNISSLADSTGQLIVLSHDSDFLCALSVNTPDRVSWHPTKLVTKEPMPGVFETYFDEWDIEQARLSVAEARVLSMSRYLKEGVGEPLAIAAEIRDLLESYICLVYRDEVERPDVIKNFTQKCRSRLGKPNELLGRAALTELKRLNKYSRQYHHPGNQALPNEVELKGMVRRTLRFCRGQRDLTPST